MRNSWNLALLPLLLLLLTTCGPKATGRHGDAVERAASHYRQVESELLAADTSHLTQEQRAARERLIAELRTYREGRNFTVNDDFPGARVPYFMDKDGRRCAVAHLLHRWGKDDLVARVVASDNHAYVSDLTGSAELRSWLDVVGVSAWEAARIQVPGSVPEREEDTPRPAPPESPPPGSPRTDDVPSGEPSPPGTSPPDGPPTTDGGAAPGSATTPGAGRPPTPGGGSRGAPGGGGTLGGRPAARRPGSGAGASRGAESWWLWWELNKLDYLTSNPLRIDLGAVTGKRTPEMDERYRRRLAVSRRATVLPHLVAELDHDDAFVRAAAVVAVGRVGGPDVVPRLVETLGDPHRFVRDRAILALGATGSEKAGEILLRIARTGAHRSRGGRRISPDARPLAILALGLLRRYGVEGPYDAAVAELVSAAKKRDLEEIGGAGLLHGILAPGSRVEAVTLRIARDQNAPDPVRARAVERLGTLKSRAALPILQRTLTGSRLELRRSAAIALAEVEHDLVLPRIMTAFELEKEPLTRGFLLLAIARQGGEKATRFLARQLEEGPVVLRPWAALALGFAARKGDRIALEELRRASLPTADQGAVWIALGLARDADSIPALKVAVAKIGSPRARSHAATALALVGGQRARHVLLSRWPEEKSAGVKIVIAQCLGVMGNDEDAGVLLSTLRGSTLPRYSGVLAVGLGFHGGDATLEGLQVLLGEGGLDPVVLATTVSAIGLLLDRRPGLEFPALSRRSNFAAAPSWLFPVLLSTL